MKKRFMISALVLSAVLMLSSCGNGGKNTVSIEGETETIRMNVDDKYTVKAKYNEKEILQWKSNDEKIAVIGADGTITAISDGITTITALTESGYDHLGVIVDGANEYTDKDGNVVQVFDGESDIESIIVGVKAGGKNDITIRKGDKFQLVAYTTPSDSKDKIVWKSKSSSTARVSEKGELEAVGIGKTVIEAYAPNGVKGELVVRVK